MAFLGRALHFLGCEEFLGYEIVAFEVYVGVQSLLSFLAEILGIDTGFSQQIQITNFGLVGVNSEGSRLSFVVDVPVLVVEYFILISLIEFSELFGSFQLLPIAHITHVRHQVQVVAVALGAE